MNNLEENQHMYALWQLTLDFFFVLYNPYNFITLNLNSDP